MHLGERRKILNYATIPNSWVFRDAPVIIMEYNVRSVGGDYFPSVRVLNAEVPSIRCLIIGDLDHAEYDSINPVFLNASACDLRGYVDALPSPSLLDDSID